MQRPVELGNKAQLSDDEYAKRLADNDEARVRELNRVGAFRNDVGTRTFRQTSLVVEPADGRSRRHAGSAEAKSNGGNTQRSNPPNIWTDRSLYDRCITRGVFGSVLPVIYGNGNFIFQSPASCRSPTRWCTTRESSRSTAVRTSAAASAVHGRCARPLGRRHARRRDHELPRQHHGCWRERRRTGHERCAHVIERFTRVAPDVLNYEVAIDDPKTFSKPVKLLLPLTTQPGYQVLPYECHEGNHALHNILSAARAEDRAADDAVKKGLPRPKPSSWLGGVNPAAPEQ